MIKTKYVHKRTKDIKFYILLCIYIYPVVEDMFLQLLILLFGVYCTQPALAPIKYLRETAKKMGEI